MSVPKEVKSVHRQWFHWTSATPIRTDRASHEQFIHPGTYFIINDKLDDWVQCEYLILQMNDRRAPILILADDCWLSFFTVPVFKSNILPANSESSHWRVNYWGGQVSTIVSVFCTCVVILCSGELLPELFCIIWMELIIEGGTEPVRLWLVEDRCQGVRDINNATGLTWHHKQETIGCLEDEMLQFLQTHGTGSFVSVLTDKTPFSLK